MSKWFYLLIPALLFGLPLLVSYGLYGGRGIPWHQADTDATGLAPAPDHTPEAVVQVYAARAYGWRGIFAVHSWLAFKPAGADRYHRVEVMGWGGGHVIRHNRLGPDDRWFGAEPDLLQDLRGPDAEAIIPAIIRAIDSYPWPETYRAVPGPNSNTFLAHIARSVPALSLDLPSTAIGKDWRPWENPIGSAPSGRGVHLSLYGLASLTLSPVEGFEMSLLGLSVGLDITPIAMRLPGLGRWPKG